MGGSLREIVDAARALSKLIDGEDGNLYNLCHRCRRRRSSHGALHVGHARRRLMHLARLRVGRDISSRRQEALDRWRNESFGRACPFVPWWVGELGLEGRFGKPGPYTFAEPGAPEAERRAEGGLPSK